MIADKAARERALDTETSFIVQAPAGSGKTELLIQRFLKLISTVDTPDGVVAITFTRKAAGEMRTRVLDALRTGRAGVAPIADHERVTYNIAREVLERDRLLGWNLLRNPSQLRIETIDALCASITRRMPWLARFGAMPEVSEKAEDLYREAARNTLRHIESGNEALAYLLLHLDNDFYAAERLLVQMLERRDQWLRHTGVNPDFDKVRADLEDSLQRLILTGLRRLCEGFSPDIAAEIALLRELDRFPEARLEDLPQWTVVADLLLTGDSEWRKRVNKTLGFPPNHPYKSRCEALLASLQREDTLLEALQNFRKLPGPVFSDSQWQALEAAVSVLTLAVAELQIVFRERGRVDFAELSIRASEALGRVESPTDLALALGYRIQHILVDEFQDTSYTQYDLLEKLTAGWEPGDGRTLFVVGDPMQSIYRFRQADVSLFLKARTEGIGAIALEPLTLSVNFRSSAEVVDWVNATFANVMPPADDLELGAVSYVESVAAASPQPSPDPRIVAHAFFNPQDEAGRVVDLVQSPGEGSVAILVRARPHLVAIVDLLRRNNIRFQAIEIDQLGERAVIEDLMALTLALLHPADRVSWLAILRAPWCGLTLADLHALAGGDHYAAVWDLLHRRDLTLSPDGIARIQRILLVLEHAIAERGRQPLRNWIEGVWLRLGGPACVEDETALEDAAAYFDLLEGLQEGADIADFEWFRDQVNALFAQPDVQAGGRLQLMTIHKAKGLEFDSVILPGLAAPTRGDDPRLLLWLEQRGELLLAPISESGKDADPVYAYLSRLERRKVENETARLLYVAATRARARLHLLGTIKTKDDGSIAEPPSGSFLKFLWPTMAQSFTAAPGAATEQEFQPARPIRCVSVDWKVPAPPPPVQWARGDIEVLQASPVTFQWAGDRLRHAGSAIHGFLQRIAREGLDSWDETAIRSRRASYGALLANLGVGLEDMDDAIQRVETGLLRTLRDSRGRWILERHAEAESELPVSGFIDGKLYEAVIDRTFIDEAGVRWIVDFKTSAHEGGDIESFLDNERLRYQEQLERYARLLVQRDQRPIRLALYFPLLGGWREWSAKSVLQKQAMLFEL
jgi:ATP-dependent helicase/nuclease subunit A